MKVYALIRQPYRSGWSVIDALKQPTLAVSIQRTGWVGDASLETTRQYPLGAELQLLNADNHETLWLGKIVERRCRSTHKRWQYKLRGICEHFLDLPFPYQALNYNRTRTGAAQAIWEFHLAKHLRYHTPRYQPVYNLNLASLQTRDLQFRTARDAFKLYQSLRPCKITPELLTDGRIRMHLDEMPLTPYPLPRNAHYELAESILETATRISFSEPAKQLFKDRRLVNPEYWELIVPSGATASVTIQDPDQYGYLGAYATRIDVDITLLVWVGLRYREKIKAPKDNQGQYLPLAVGCRSRGDNAQIRLVVNNTPSTPQGAGSMDGYTEIAWLVTPAADELTLALEIQPITPTLPATVILDALYCIPAATANLNERDYPPHLPVADQIPSYLTGATTLAIAAVSNVSPGVYDLVAPYDAFPPSIPTGTTIQILQNSGYLQGEVINRQNPTTLRVQIPNGAPQPGDILYLAHGPAPNSELLYDALYTQLDTPAAPALTNLSHLIEQIASPSIALTAQFPLAQGAPLPQIGQLALYGHDASTSPLHCKGTAPPCPLPIYEIELPITNGRLQAIQIRAGTPELTMRALLRRLTPTRTRTP